MNDTPHDEKGLEEVIRKIMELSGDGRPFVIGMKIIIGGYPRGANPLSRGDATEPEIEIQTIGDRVVLSTELPGISPEQIQVLFREDRVFIWAKDPDRQYSTSRKVPPAKKGSVEISFRHGVLEVSYSPAAEPSRFPGM
jgi:HSP20 family molecular chaperone IbpA